MKHLIKFSLSRRFKNKFTIILHVVMTCLLFCFVFSDKIIERFISDSQQITIIYYDESVDEYVDYFDQNNDIYLFKAGYKENSINVSLDSTWKIESKYSLDIFSSSQIRMLIEDAVINKWLSEMSEQSTTLVLDKIYPIIEEVSMTKVGVSSDKQTISMFIITGIYFAMLSFSTMIANEVVYEKTSRVLELILTSINTTVHYLSKMIIGWLTVLIQLAIVCLELLIVFATRNYYDKGLGLISMLRKYNLLQVEANTFKEFITALEINASLIWVLIISLIYLLLGMVIIQTIMVCISSFIKSIEESGAIQAPVYLVLLVVYYIALALNSPARLNSGIGYYLSFAPIFSMLFMPMRLLLLSVSFYEIGLGILISVVLLVITTYYGAYIYNIGILGGLNIKSSNKVK